MADVENFEAHYLERENAHFYGLIRKLWINAANPVELDKIRDDFGVENISNGLNFKNPLGVKATIAVLLYVAVSDGYADFFSDIFLDNVITALSNSVENLSNFFLLARLIRVLQTYKSFSDWIITRGATAKENRLWEKLNEFSHHSDEELKKESIRAVKEGTRTGATQDQWCIIPDRVVEKMRTEIIWKITDIEDEELDELSKGSIEGARGDEEIARLEQINKQLRGDGSRRIAALEAEIEAEGEERERIQNDISKIYRAIQALRESLGESLTGGYGLLDGVSDDSVSGLRKRLSALGGDVSGLLRGDNDLRRRVQEGVVDVKAIRRENDASDPGHLRSEVVSNLSTNLQALQNTLKVASVTTTPENDNPSSLGFSSLSASVSNLRQTDDNLFAPENLSTSWAAPVGGNLPTEDVLPFGWTRKHDARTNHYYYYQRTTGKVQWNIPLE